MSENSATQIGPEEASRTFCDLVVAQGRIAELEAREAELVEMLRRATSKTAVRAALQEHDLATLAAADSALSEWRNEAPRGLGGDAVEKVRAVLEDLREAVGQLELKYEWGGLHAVDKIAEALALLPRKS